MLNLQVRIYLFLALLQEFYITIHLSNLLLFEFICLFNFGFLVHVHNLYYCEFFFLYPHESIFHLLVTLILQLWIMRRIEQMIGWIRMMIIYISSGCVGTLASAILTPYQVEVGILHAVNSDPALINSVIWYTIHNVVLQYHNSKSLCSVGINVFFQGYTESRYWNEFFWCT